MVLLQPRSACGWKSVHRFATLRQSSYRETGSEIARPHTCNTHRSIARPGTRSHSMAADDGPYPLLKPLHGICCCPLPPSKPGTMIHDCSNPAPSNVNPPFASPPDPRRLHAQPTPLASAAAFADREHGMAAPDPAWRDGVHRADLQEADRNPASILEDLVSCSFNCAYS